MLLWTLECICPFESVFLYPLGKYLVVQSNHMRLLTIENKLRVTEGAMGGGWAKCMMGIKEDTCVEHLCWASMSTYVNDESLNTTPETNIALYVN